MGKSERGVDEGQTKESRHTPMLATAFILKKGGNKEVGNCGNQRKLGGHNRCGKGCKPMNAKKMIVW